MGIRLFHERGNRVREGHRVFQRHALDEQRLVVEQARVGLHLFGIARVADMLAKKKFKKLPVVDDEGKLVGVIRRSAITKYIFNVIFQ